MFVSSLWTPEGEHKVERPVSPAGATSGDGSAPQSDGPGRPSREGSGGPGRAEGPEDEVFEEAELDEVRRQLLEAPVEVVIANHAYGLFELAALHLSALPPDLLPGPPRRRCPRGTHRWARRKAGSGRAGSHGRPCADSPCLRSDQWGRGRRTGVTLSFRH